MKNRLLVLAVSVAAFLSPAAYAQDAGTPAAPPPPPAPAVSNERVLEVYGWFLGQQFEIDAFDFDDAEFAAFARGVRLAAKGERPDGDIQEVGMALQEFLRTRPAQVQERQVSEGRAEEQAFFAKLDANPEILKTASGLRYQVTKEGTGAKPSLSDEVVAHYTGTFVDGKVFDSSVERDSPETFPLNGVIRGWQEGLQLIGVGGKITLYVPSELGYGDTGNRAIPPARALIFRVELLEARPQPPTLAPSDPFLIPTP